MKSFTFLLLSIFTVATLYAKQNVNLVSADSKKYCYTTSSGKFEITLEQGGDNKTYYKLYNGSGELVKTMQGYWEIRDEGVYGSLYVLTIRWSGLNADLPSLKFTCQYNASGQLQQLIDSQKRNWYPCN